MVFVGFFVGVLATELFNRYAKARVIAKVNEWIAGIGAP